ncbi:MAG: KOW motif-containing protein [Bdellovibrionales bacterium]|jgi:large subunit ribosomal protein L24|nr:KOW motif-containing protein [Bdellovibrionales bacterium]MBK8203536.1 KOW motif-containing protein [Bdellovibrionales bacterium]MBK9040158.1 KOW motif-containing protein [Bdellovibrionales bacterium]
MKLKIKKGATVEVIAGADKGKRGSVLEINPGKLLVRVQGVRMQTHFDKKDGLKTLEGYLNYSNVKLVEQVAAAKKTAKKKVSARK